MSGAFTEPGPEPRVECSCFVTRGERRAAAGGGGLHSFVIARQRIATVSGHLLDIISYNRY